MVSLIRENPLPREIAPGVFWLSECYLMPHQSTWLHTYNASYLVVSGNQSAVIEAGLAGETDVVIKQLEDLIARGAPEPEFVFVTHSEVPHAGGCGDLLARFPQASLYGDVTDLHLVWPEYAGRMHMLDPGDKVTVGATEIFVVEGVFRDLLYSRWFFEPSTATLFPGDGFAYTHYHQPGACGSFAEDVPDLDLSASMESFALAAFHWTRYVDIEPYIDRLDKLLFEELVVRVIAPSHGLAIRDPAATMPLIRAGLRQISNADS